MNEKNLKKYDAASTVLVVIGIVAVGLSLARFYATFLGVAGVICFLLLFCLI